MEWMQGLFIAAAGSAFVLAGALALLARHVPRLGSARWWAVAWAAQGMFILLSGVVPDLSALPGPVRGALDWAVHAFGILHAVGWLVGARRLAAGERRSRLVLGDGEAPGARSVAERRRIGLIVGGVLAAALLVTLAGLSVGPELRPVLRNAIRQACVGGAVLVAALWLTRAWRATARADGPWLRTLALLLDAYAFVLLGNVAAYHVPRLLGATPVLGRAWFVLMPALDVWFVVAFGAVLVTLVVDERTRLAASVDALRTRVTRAEQFESLGRLAGGISHDFGNLVMIMRLQADGLAEQVATLGGQDALATVRATMQHEIEELGAMVDRAAGLVSELRTFSRRERRVVALLDPVELLQRLEPALRRLAGPNVALAVHAAADVPCIEASATQLERVLVNLVANARDAMPDGGTCTVDLAAGPTGDGIVLRVRDTGIGMDDAVRGHIFEPFFTTKATGTGLGLPTVFGIVQQGGGRIAVDSAPGAGTLMTVVLPAVPPADAIPPDGPPDGPPLGRNGGLAAGAVPSLRAPAGAAVAVR